jgi:hypothetical protein
MRNIYTLPHGRVVKADKMAQKRLLRLKRAYRAKFRTGIKVSNAMGRVK